MSDLTPCSALNNAMRTKGVSAREIAQNVGSTEQRIHDIISGKERATEQEFKSLASTLNITSTRPHDSAHATK